MSNEGSRSTKSIVTEVPFLRDRQRIGRTLYRCHDAFRRKIGFSHKEKFGHAPYLPPRILQSREAFFQEFSAETPQVCCLGEGRPRGIVSGTRGAFHRYWRVRRRTPIKDLNSFSVMFSLGGGGSPSQSSIEFISALKTLEDQLGCASC